MIHTPSNNRIIHLPLRKAYFANYLRHEFGVCSTDDIRISRLKPLGKYIFSMVRYSDLPMSKPIGEIATIVLPNHELDRCDYRFVYFSTEDVERINDFIEAQSYLDFRSFMQVGTNDLKIDRKTVINLFTERVLGEDKFEMLKKDDYRRRKKMGDFLLKSIQEFEY